MKIRDLRIEGFGVLSALPLHDLNEGLTVLHGPNGSGKSTLLQFIRGLFLGYSEARRLRLLPPLRGGTPGGSMVLTDSVRFTLTRHARNDLSDTLAINVSHGSADDARRLRATIEGLRPDLFRTLYAVGSLEAHSLGHLVDIAERDGIDLRTRRSDATWLRSQMETLQGEQSGLLAAPPQQGRIQELETERERLRVRIDACRGEQQTRHEDHSATLRRLREQEARLQREIDWLDEQLQAVQCDLDACHDRLWGRTSRTIRTVRRVEVEQPAAVPLVATVLPEIEELDRQIEHCRQVLRDLASSRRTLTVESASLAGAETPNDPVTIARDRAALRLLEGNLHRLDGLVEQVLEAQKIGRCLCDATQAALASSSESMREQVYLLCQSLNRREKESQRRALLAQRDGVDRMELDLEARIRDLRSRRDAMLTAQAGADRERIRYRSDLERLGCECDTHARWEASAVAPAARPVERSIVEIPEEQIAEDPTARPGDAALARELADLKDQLWLQLQGVRGRQAALIRDLARIEGRAGEFADDRALQTMQYEYSVLEQKLADSRSQWQSLALLQATLNLARRKLENEVQPPVIADASATFRRLTEERYSGFRYAPETRELYAVLASGQQHGLSSLSRGTLDQAALSLRLALADEYARRGLRLPFIFDDVLVDTDEGRLRIAVTVLKEAAARGHQILFLTCQDHLATLFHEMGIAVRGLHRDWQPSVRGAATESRPSRGPEMPVAIERRFVEPIAITPVVPPLPAPEAFSASDLADEVGETLALRSQPDSPFWLQADSPVSLIPSLGAQMGRRLGAIGIANVADLIDVDPESVDMPLSSLQVSAAQLRTWQAEGRLLCCVPGLTGRDAQLIVACGIVNPAELAEIDPDVLLARAVRLREAASPGAFEWLGQGQAFPSRESARQWIGSAHRARTLADALDAAGWGEDDDGPEGEGDGGNGFDGDDPGPFDDGRGPRTLRRARRTRAGRKNRVTLRNSASRMRLRAESAGERGSKADPSDWRYFLQTDSLVVEAPSIGPKMAERLKELGILTVSDLIGRRPESISAGLTEAKVTARQAQDWQRQAVLMCRVPELRGHDAQILVACGVDTAEQLAGMAPATLWKQIEPFLETRDAARVLRSATPPDLDEVTDWVRFAGHSRALRAA